MVVHHLCEFHHFNLIYQFNRFIYSEMKQKVHLGDASFLGDLNVLQ